MTRGLSLAFQGAVSPVTKELPPEYVQSPLYSMRSFSMTVGCRSGAGKPPRRQSSDGRSGSKRVGTGRPEDIYGLARIE